jgi:hypothetical protein
VLSKVQARSKRGNYVSSPKDSPAKYGAVSDVIEVEPHQLDADTFGMSVCSLTRDSYFMSIEGFSMARLLRIVSSLFIAWTTIWIQVFLLLKVKEFVSAKAVHDIREAYDKYELTIYGGVQHTTLTVNGKHRGIDKFFPPLAEARKRLATLSDDEQDAICHIPLSQPSFFAVILLVWTILCMAELRKAYNLQSAIVNLKTVPTMAEALQSGSDEKSKSDGLISGMTLWMKAVTTFFIFIPRVLITLYLLWVGCRWLLGTTEFDNLVSNAVALEFILLVKDILYMALTPLRNHIDLSITQIEPHPKTLRPAPLAFAMTLLLLAVACGWVYLYIGYVQVVLPGYKWDIRSVCEEYMKKTNKV